MHGSGSTPTTSSTTPDRAGVRRHTTFSVGIRQSRPERSFLGIRYRRLHDRLPICSSVSDPTAGTDVFYAVRTSPSTMISVRFG
jgi:hypothetical protein